MSECSILISSSGRRVGLMGCFREALRDLGIKGGVYAIDCSPSSPAFQLADRAWIVPRCTDPGFPDTALKFCLQAGIRLVIPTIDTELPVYAEIKERFATHGIHVCVSSPEVVELCGDKCLTHSFFERNGFPTVRQASPQRVLQSAEEWQFPVIAKPVGGSASVGVRRVNRPDELAVIADDPNLLVQELAEGMEYTINLYIDGRGECVCAVPHARLEVRSGEVSKGVTVKNATLMDLAKRVGEALPGARGPLNLQCFMQADGTIKLIEINARFGGGYPLAHKAGACFTKWLIEDALHLTSERHFDRWQDDLAMLRYDDAVFISGAGLRPMEQHCVA